MKRTFFILALMSCAAGIMAQKRSFFRVEAGYANTRLLSRTLDNSDLMHGGQVSFFAGWQFTAPLYVEAGLSALMAGFDKTKQISKVTYTDDKVTYSDGQKREQMTCATLGVPINVGWRFALADGVCLQPFGGVSLNVGLSGHDKVRYDWEDHVFSSVGMVGQRGNYAGAWRFSSAFDIDWYDDFNRCRLGGQAGLLLRWNDWSLSYQYQCDITPLKYSTESRSRTNSVSVGYFF
ncbi:MAG: autotransporter outer membrane beta-barrel domain-containing protein [Bacteroidales bacterium]|nr:autotransporter outer membrane beta-barrel domain-containing protein [Bacteroidales bacterium]